MQRIWSAHRLQPHRIRTFKRSNDPAFANKLADIVGLYMAPPRHAVVLSVDEKSQIQALDRTQPGLPLKPGKAGTMTHDYIRNGTTTLFAALNVLDGTVLGRCMQRHRHQEFIRFLNAVEARCRPASWSTHPRQLRHAQASQGPGLARQPSAMDVSLHADLGSWLNAVEGFFSTLTRRRLQRGAFQSIVDLQDAIPRYIAKTTPTPSLSSGQKPPKPFSPNSTACLYLPNESVH